MRKKKILLTFSKNRNSKVYSYTFNIYCAYWLLQYKAMVILKIVCKMARLIGSLAFIWVALEGGVCSSINPVPCKQVRPNMQSSRARPGHQSWSELRSQQWLFKLSWEVRLLLGNWWPHEVEGRSEDMGPWNGSLAKLLHWKQFHQETVGSEASCRCQWRRVSWVGTLLATSGCHARQPLYSVQMQRLETSGSQNEG